MLKSEAIKLAKERSKKNEGELIAYYDDNYDNYNVFEYFHGSFEQMDLKPHEVIACFEGGQYQN